MSRLFCRLISLRSPKRGAGNAHRPTMIDLLMISAQSCTPALEPGQFVPSTIAWNVIQHVAHAQQLSVVIPRFYGRHDHGHAASSPTSATLVW